MKNESAIRRCERCERCMQIFSYTFPVVARVSGHCHPSFTPRPTDYTYRTESYFLTLIASSSSSSHRAYEIRMLLFIDHKWNKQQTANGKQDIRIFLENIQMAPGPFSFSHFTTPNSCVRWHTPKSVRINFICATEIQHFILLRTTCVECNCLFNTLPNCFRRLMALMPSNCSHSMKCQQWWEIVVILFMCSLRHVCTDAIIPEHWFSHVFLISFRFISDPGSGSDSVSAWKTNAWIKITKW